MKRLLIVRHAKAERGGPHQKDFDRPLAPRGEDDAAEMGRRLSRGGEHPVAMLASPALRTLATAKIIARELDFPWAEIRSEKSVYLAGPDELLDLVRDIDDAAQCALLVGHNPGVSELAQMLVRGFTYDLQTCALVAVDLPADSWAGVKRHTGSLRLYDFPKNTV